MKSNQRAAAEGKNSPAIDNLQWFLIRENPTFTNLDEHLILDHELNPVWNLESTKKRESFIIENVTCFRS